MPHRVLLVGNFLSATRANRSVGEELAARLAGAGWSVRTTSSEPRRLPRLADMMRTAWSARREYDVAQVDVFSGAAFCWAESVCAVLRRAHKPYVLTLHGGNLPDFARRWPRRARRLLASAAVVTTPSRYLLEELRPHRDDLVLLPNAIELPRYSFRVREAPAPRLVWLRAFHPIYEPELAVAVLERLARAHPDARLAMAGAVTDEGAHARALARAERAGVAERVRIVRGVAKRDVPAWLDAGDIFLNTATVDNTPVSVIEAMASGLCIVSTRVGGIPHLVRDGESALLVPAGDADAMAAAVSRLLREPGLAPSLSRAARREAERFGWEGVLPRWEALLGALAERAA